MSQPSKEKVQRWIQERAKERKPLPSQEELRRQLGTEMIEMARREMNPFRR